MSKEPSYCMYLRKSRADQDAERHGEGETLARHEKALYALANQLNITINTIFREIVSGETLSARPEMQKLLQQVEAGLWDGVLVMEVERLARGATIDQGIVAQAFQISGTKIITPSKIYDPEDEFDQEYFEFGLFMSRREYKTINRRIQRGRIASAKEGRFIGSAAPFGYRRYKLENDKGWSLEIVPEQADIVRLVFDLYVNGQLLPDGSRKKVASSTICRILDDAGMHPLLGDTWSPSSIRGMLKNPTYIGKIRWGYDTEEKSVKDGEIVKIRKRNSKCIFSDGLHDPIIDDDTYYKAQALLKSNAHNSVPASRKLKNPLAGIVYCKKCGHLMTRLGANVKTPYDALKCPNRYCNSVSAPLYLVEEKILAVLSSWLLDFQVDPDAVDQNNSVLDAYLSTSSALEAELTSLNKQLSKTFDLLERGIYDDETFLTRNQILKNKISAAEKSLADLNDKINKVQDVMTVQDTFIPTVKRIVDGYSNLEDASVKNNLLKTVLERVDYNKDKPNTRGKRNNDNFTVSLYPKIPTV